MDDALWPGLVQHVITLDSTAESDHLIQENCLVTGQCHCSIANECSLHNLVHRNLWIDKVCACSVLTSWYV